MTMNSREPKPITDLSYNDLSIEDKTNSFPIRFMGKVRYQCASSIITIPVSIVRELNLKLGETVIMSIIKIDNNDDLQIKQII